MKKRISIILSVLILSICFSCSNSESRLALKQIQISADSLKQIMDPDSRTGIVDYTITLKNDSILVKGKTDNPEFKESIFRMIGEQEIYSIDSLVVLPEAELGESVWALINVSVANLRSQPGHSKEMATQAILGTPVKVLEKQGSWYRIQTPDKYLSWVESSSIHLLSDENLEIWKQSNRLIYLNDYGIIRSTKDKNSPAVSDIVYGGLLRLASYSGKYAKVILPDKRIGYLPKSEVLNFSLWMTTIEPIPQEFIDLAYNMIGRPYLWGGTSTKGMDCSGFVKTLYFSGGLILNRDASQQVNQGELVNTENSFKKLIPGDLLFFGRKETDSKKERITHVGMYVDNDIYIHSSGKVKLNSFNPDSKLYSQYLVDIFVRAKRIIDTNSDQYQISVSNHPWYK